jgi:hypothetical protein
LLFALSVQSTQLKMKSTKAKVMAPTTSPIYTVKKKRSPNGMRRASIIALKSISQLSVRHNAAAPHEGDRLKKGIDIPPARQETHTTSSPPSAAATFGAAAFSSGDHPVL